jgi:Glyoxalase/Bleomycin resistance protein/Dioxygenase superfamily
MKHTVDSLLHQYESGWITRRDLIASLVCLIMSSVGATDLQSLYGATELNHPTIRVSDLKRSKEFYQRVLGLSLMKEDSESVYPNGGKGWLSLWRTNGSAGPGLDHFCFGVPNFDRKTGMAKLTAAGMSLRHDKDDPATFTCWIPTN